MSINLFNILQLIQTVNSVYAPNIRLCVSKMCKCSFTENVITKRKENLCIMYTHAISSYNLPNGEALNLLHYFEIIFFCLAFKKNEKNLMAETCS